MRILYLIIFFLSIISFAVYDFVQDTKLNKKNGIASNNYIAQMHIKLSGIVTDCYNIDHGSGLLRLNLYTSSPDFYDPRANDSKYFAVIKDGKAEVIAIYSMDTKIGDSVVINSDLNEYKIYRGDSLIVNTGLTINFSDFFFKSLWKLHRL